MYTIFLAVNPAATLFSILQRQDQEIIYILYQRTPYIYVKSENQSQPTDQHFNLPGHTLSNIKAKILEKCKEDNTTYIYILVCYNENKDYF